MIARLRQVWRAKVPYGVRRRIGLILTPIFVARLRAATRGRPPVTAPMGPLQVVGLFEHHHGIAQMAHLTSRALDALGATYEKVSVSAMHEGGLSPLAEPRAAPAWLFFVNPPELHSALNYLGVFKVQGPRIGSWAWELPRAPKRWVQDARMVDEVWGISRFVADAFAGAPAPVRAVPLPLVMDDYKGVKAASRAPGFQAVALFDFNSSVARKNPFGVIEAFRRAFDGDPSARLTFKTQNGDRFPELLARLRGEAGANVEVIDEVWPRERVLAFMKAADVLMSLHRAEGFGLTLAEAMALGVPTVATGYSGNLEFMDEDSGVLVPYALVPAEDVQGRYRGQQWAEPDLDAAAAGLRRLRDDAPARKRMAAAAKRKIEAELSPQAWLNRLSPELRAVIEASRRS